MQGIAVDLVELLRASLVDQSDHGFIDFGSRN